MASTFETSRIKRKEQCKINTMFLFVLVSKAID